MLGPRFDVIRWREGWNDNPNAKAPRIQKLLMLDIRSPILAKGEILRLLREWLSLSAKMADRVLCHSIDTVARDFYGVSQHGR